MNKKLTLAALALCLSGAAHANLLTNGNFEAGLTGWTGSGVMGLATAPYFGGGTPAANGSYMAVFNQGESIPNARLWQSFATITGHQYHVTFDYGTNNGNYQAVEAVAHTDSTLLQSLTFVSPGPALAGASFDFIATESLTTLTFIDVVSNYTFSTDGLLDNVVVTDRNAVPEPASLVLLSLGLAGIGALRRRQR